jgi:hypothetical protein
MRPTGIRAWASRNDVSLLPRPKLPCLDLVSTRILLAGRLQDKDGMDEAAISPHLSHMHCRSDLREDPQNKTRSLDRPLHWNAAGMLSILAGIIDRHVDRRCVDYGGEGLRHVLSSAFIQSTTSIFMYLALFSLPFVLLSLDSPTGSQTIDFNCPSEANCSEYGACLAAQQRVPPGKSPDLQILSQRASDALIKFA